MVRLLRGMKATFYPKPPLYYSSSWLETVEQITRSEGLPVIPDEKTGEPIWVDVRELRLKYLLPIKKVKKFFDGLKEGKVYATRCPVKNVYYFPPQVDCPLCMDENVEWVEISGKGHLLTYTVINVKPVSYLIIPLLNFWDGIMNRVA